MPKISKKAIEMPASPIRKLVPYAEAAKKRSVKVYHLNIGQPDIKSPECALEAVKNFDHEVIEYGHSAGNESYRRALADFYTNIGISVDYSQIIITTGGSEAIIFAFTGCLDEGDEVLITEPFYANYYGFAIETGVKVTTVPALMENNFALPSIEEFEKRITPRTKAILVCNPNNPTGYLYTREELEQLKALVLKYDLFLIADEVYREFCYDGREHVSVMSLSGIDQNVILIDSVSKRYSMCGVRAGALITRNKEVLNSCLKFAQARLCPPMYAQVAGEAAVKTPSSYFKEVYNEYVERRNFIVDALNKIEGVYCPMPGGAFYTVVQLPVDDSDKFAQWLLEEFSYKNQTVMLAPASGFYATHGLGKNQVRIAYVLKIEDLRNAVECLDVALKEYNSRKSL